MPLHTCTCAVLSTSTSGCGCTTCYNMNMDMCMCICRMCTYNVSTVMQIGDRGRCVRGSLGEPARGTPQRKEQLPVEKEPHHIRTSLQEGACLDCRPVAAHDLLGAALNV